MPYARRLALLIAASATLGAACSSDSAPSGTAPASDAGDAGTDAAVTHDASTADTSQPAPDGGGEPSAPDAGMDATPTDGAADASPVEPVEVAEFCKRTQQIACTWATECRPFEDCDAWGGMQGLRQLCEYLPGRLSAGNVDYDPVAAGKCLAYLESTTCDTGGPPLPAFGPCQEEPWLVPKTEVGEPCYAAWNRWGSECVEGSCVTDTCPGTCTPFQKTGEPCDEGAGCAPSHGCVDSLCVPPAEAGESCAMTSCIDGLECAHIDDNDYRCFVPKEEGDDCEEPEPCGGSLICVDGTCSTESRQDGPCSHDGHCPEPQHCVQGPEPLGRCRQPKVLGDACDDELSNECASPSWCEESLCVGPGFKDDPCDLGCAEGFWCRGLELDGGAFDSSCQPVGGPGDACGSRFPQADACLGALVCIGGVCGDRAGEDEPCEPQLTNSCESGLFCSDEDSVCRPPAALGERCTSSNSCQDGGYCAFAGDDAFTTCLAVKAEGALCDYTSGECGSLYCDEDASGTPRCTASAPECLPELSD